MPPSLTLSNVHRPRPHRNSKRKSLLRRSWKSLREICLTIRAASSWVTNLSKLKQCSGIDWTIESQQCVAQRHKVPASLRTEARLKLVLKIPSTMINNPRLSSGGSSSNFHKKDPSLALRCSSQTHLILKNCSQLLDQRADMKAVHTILLQVCLSKTTSSGRNKPRVSSHKDTNRQYTGPKVKSQASIQSKLWPSHQCPNINGLTRNMKSIPKRDCKMNTRQYLLKGCLRELPTLICNQIVHLSALP